jgi:hypothetical protein
MSINSPMQTIKIGGKSLAIALVAMFSVATVGLAGTTYAVSQNGDSPTAAPASKEDCKNGGWKNYGYKNQGQCIKAVNKDDHGYGGGNNNSVSTWLNLDITGDNNVVNVVINYIFG